jgi:hypothetical protein
VWNRRVLRSRLRQPRGRPPVDWGHDAQGRKYGVDVPIIDTTCFYTYNGQQFRNAAGKWSPSRRPRSRRAPPTSAPFRTTIDSVRFQSHPHPGRRPHQELHAQRRA